MVRVILLSALEGLGNSIPSYRRFEVKLEFRSLLNR